MVAVQMDMGILWKFKLGCFQLVSLYIYITITVLIFFVLGVGFEGLLVWLVGTGSLCVAPAVLELTL